MHFLVTAGNTREKIDSVRDWGNIFTGTTGLLIARALSELGPVDLLSSNASHLESLTSPDHRQAHPIVGSIFQSHAELRAALAALMTHETFSAVFMTAAVSDYSPTGVFEVLERSSSDNGEQTWRVRNVQSAKVRSSYREIAVAGRQTEKLVDLFRTEWGHSGLLVKFKLEVGIDPDALLMIGEQSRRASSADYLVANTLDMITGEEAGASCSPQVTNGSAGRTCRRGWHVWWRRTRAFGLTRRVSDEVEPHCRLGRCLEGISGCAAAAVPGEVLPAHISGDRLVARI